jgi:tripartite-type tricarboxylate transporter receptor subunit TctC
MTLRPRHITFRLTGALAVVALLIGSMAVREAWSQARTIRIVVPFPAGGSADILARLLGEHIAKNQGTSVVIENRPGGGASIAYEAVARAAPDGNTLVINGNSIIINPHLRKVSYHPITSFEPVCYLLSSPQVFVVNAASPYKTLAEFVAGTKAQAGTLVFATVGPATTQHIGFEQFRQLSKIDVTYVPYPGGAPAMTALLGGHVHAVLANYSEAVEQLHSGKVRALAVASLKRIPPLPDVPTVDELGYKGYNAEVWFGVMAPAKTPRNATAQLATWFQAALKAPELTPRLLKLGLYPVGTCLDDFAVHVRNQYEQYGRVIREAGIKAQ